MPPLAIKNTDTKLVCSICNKTLHLTTEITEFDKKGIEFLIKFKHDLIHICNACKQQKDQFLKKLETETKNEIEEKLEKFKEIQALTKNIEKSSNILANVQTEVKTVKKDDKTYKHTVDRNRKKIS